MSNWKCEEHGYVYNPPAWRVCPECGGHRDILAGHPGTCKSCNGTGKIPIFYTPDQWQNDDGILSDDTQVWHDGGAGVFRAGSWGALKGINPNGWIIIIAIPGQPRPPADWRPREEPYERD